MALLLSLVALSTITQIPEAISGSSSKPEFSLRGVRRSAQDELSISAPLVQCKSSIINLTWAGKLCSMTTFVWVHDHS